MKNKGLIAYLLFVALVISGWLTAVITDAGANWGWLAVDLIVSPIGVVRGFLIWFGLAG